MKKCELLSIYDDIGDYIPEINKEKLKETNIKQSKREYFEKDHQVNLKSQYNTI